MSDFIEVFHIPFACADPESFARGGSTFLIRGKRIQIALKAGHHRLASETPLKWRFALMAFRWRVDDGPTLNAEAL